MIGVVMLCQLSSFYLCHKLQAPDTLLLVSQTNRSPSSLEPGQKKCLWANPVSMFFLVDAWEREQSSYLRGSSESRSLSSEQEPAWVEEESVLCLLSLGRAERCC